MDIVYTTPLIGNDVGSVKDIGELQNFSADFAFGKSENNFEIKMYIKEACLERGSLVYAENTEIGGIVDAITIDSAREEITYSGRTWQGVLASKIVKPPSGADYFETSKNVSDTVVSLLTSTGLIAICTLNIPIGLELAETIKARYDNLYDVFKNILEDNDLKLKLTMGRDHHINIGIATIKDYSQDELLREKSDYIAKRNYRPVNHIICLGSGQMQDRHVIDLFFDAAGNVQPYAISEGSNLNDTMYILDNRNQVLFGADEVTAIYDYSGANTKQVWVASNLSQMSQTEWMSKYMNYYYRSASGEYVKYQIERIDCYQPLETKPSDWDSNVSRYYKLVNGKYVNVEMGLQSTFTILTDRPHDWSTNYGMYYEDWENNVQGIEEETLQEVSNPQKDFSQNYQNYYTLFWDGTQYVPTRVPSKSVDYYEKQSRRPDDWATNWGNYYRKKKSGGYEAVPGDHAPNWGKRDYYTKKTKTVAPSYDSSLTYYQYVKQIVAPTFVANMYYKKKDTWSAPTFSALNYYQHITSNSVPTKPTYAYVPTSNHYEDLIINALKKYKNEIRGDEMTMKLREDVEYDVGDIVGTEDYITGLVVTQKIVKKIVKIKDDKTTITYEEGESLW